MGWCSGSYLAEKLYNEIREFIPEKKRKKIAKKVYDIFCDLDADCWENNMNIIIDANECWDVYED